MKVYLALFSLNKDSDCFETISVHETEKGVKTAIEEHKQFVYDSSDVFFPDGQLNLCVWDWKEVNLHKWYLNSY